MRAEGAMSGAEPARARAGAGAVPRPEPGEAAGLGLVLPAAEVERALGQTIREALDLSGWDEGGELEALLRHVDDSVGHSVLRQERVCRQVRDRVLPLLPALPHPPACAPVHPP